MSQIDRRRFIRNSVLAGSVALGLEGLVARGVMAHPRYGEGFAGKGFGGYGPIAPVASANTGETLLSLPEGFAYTVFGRVWTPMSDGRLTPPAHDGMAAFDVGGELRLVRNHELRLPPFASIGDPETSYDPLASGGTTTLIVDPNSRELVRDFVSLSGTLVNCAGGPTPWGTWISCEETTVGTSIGFEQAHGYCFEVASYQDSTVMPVPLKAMGRFVHEAVAVDPETGIVYLTEDHGTAGLYRYIPDEPGFLAAGGRLQMLAIANQPNYDTRTGQTPLQTLPVSWVDIHNPDPVNAEWDSLAVYRQGIAAGGATFGRLEGCWFGNRSVYANSTNGGDIGRGQVWQYVPRNDSDGELILLFESPSADVLDAPDNLCVSPRLGLVLCEDGGGEQYLRGLTPRGQIFDFAQNLITNRDGSANEFAGATFSPDGQTLFVNVQTPGTTFAIWGPWELGAL